MTLRTRRCALHLQDPLGYFSSRLEFTAADAAPVPEPASLALLALGLLGVKAARRRRSARQLT